MFSSKYTSRLTRTPYTAVRCTYVSIRPNAAICNAPSLHRRKKCTDSGHGRDLPGLRGRVPGTVRPAVRCHVRRREYYAGHPDVAIFMEGIDFNPPNSCFSTKLVLTILSGGPPFVSAHAWPLPELSRGVALKLSHTHPGRTG